MDGVSAAASILAIAGAGIQISLKLIAFADQVGTAPRRIQEVGADVSVTAGTLQELSELMKTSSEISDGMFSHDQVQNILTSATKCESIFDELKNILGKASQQLRAAYKSTAKSSDASAKITLSRIERIKWPFLQPSVQPLRSALGDAKATLTLILQVVHLRYAHITASLDGEEQNDLIRMIAAMRRQQVASTCGPEGGYKSPDASDTEDSDSGAYSEVKTVLEAWSVAPNTLAENASQHLLITQIPVSQQQVTEILKTSPQDFQEISSIIDSLSSPERNAILGDILEDMYFHSDKSTIRSISCQKWTGSHFLFGRVTSRKFNLIIEKRVEKIKSSRAQKFKLYYVDDPDSDEIRGTARLPQPQEEVQMDHRRARAREKPLPHISRPTSPKGKKNQHIIERKQKEESGDSDESDDSVDHSILRSSTESQYVSEISDDELVRKLLAEYTTFKIDEPLVQGIATTPPIYEEASIPTERSPQPH